MFHPNLLSKKIQQSLVIGSVCLASLIGCSQPQENKTVQNDDNTKVATTDSKSIAITAIVEHPALDDVRAGVLEQLAADGYKEGENLKVSFQSAQGNTATAGQIAKQFVADSPDVIVAIATPSAQSMIAATSNIPVVFSAVTDPVEAKLIPSWEASNTNVTGASDILPLEPQIELMKKVIPTVKNIGYVYSPGEVNSTVVLKQLQEKLKPMNINVIAAPAQRSTDIVQAARSLQGKVDLIYTSLDNNVVSAYEALYQAAKEIKVPLIASDTGSVSRGAVAALGVNYKTLGQETGKIVTRVLKGEKAGSIKPITLQNLDLVISPKHAEEVGITLPDALVKEASIVEPTK
ncbi:ABC transporter substrate-binding protein [Moraxella macacae 0408225]|uniref:ABC transporter substrate-binding protein n=1 Tax=Moraxella macacae 0408225 TaxID=1230338 RepID=L2F6Z5_9GAMM|nr:ABC transporter substrate-binding protein [Moraxella macacae]ELA08854.1 ABC transporter substrate-binding protein [Moraxella macacae 0408225]